MPLDNLSALTDQKVVGAVASSNVLNVLLSALEVYSVIVSALILTLSAILTYYAVRKHKKENILLDIKIEETKTRRMHDK